MTAVCGCGHPHLPGQAWCYACDRPTNVPAAERAGPPARETATPAPPAGTQTTDRCICGRTITECAEAGRQAAGHG